jgi:hypothetical protein
MIDLNTCKKALTANGQNLAQHKRNQSNQIINLSFTRDPNYKRVYILTKEGWKYEDAKYQTHTTPSILKDAVDYYLQFRPKIHYPIGSYVIVPDDTGFDINLSGMEIDDPFEQPIENRTQWWIIVGKDDSPAYVRYNILKCNWNFQWIWEGNVQSCFGCLRSANSYTSGRWDDEISSSLDNLTGFWLPDLHYTYGDNLKKLHLDDNRTIMHEQRFMMTTNLLDPKVYQVTKVVDLNPLGIIKYNVKQDDLDRKVDNVELRICNYYSSSGESKVTDPIQENIISDNHKTSEIYSFSLDSDNELIESDKLITSISLGTTFYYSVKFSDKNVSPEWHLKIIDTSDEYSSDKKTYFEGLIKMIMFEDGSISLKPGKANSLIGKCFELSVSDISGEYYSSIELEVVE